MEYRRRWDRDWKLGLELATHISQVKAVPVADVLESFEGMEELPNDIAVTEVWASFFGDERA